MVTRIALIGASNLVSFESQQWVACTCEATCKVKEHSPQVPADIVYKIYAAGGAKFRHPKPDKNAAIMFHTAIEEFKPNVVVFYHDIIMNSLCLSPFAPPNATVLTPQQVYEDLRVLERDCPCHFAVILCRRRKEDAIKITPSNKADGDQQFESTIDLEMNRFLKDHFNYLNLKLTNSSFNVNDAAHQTVDSLKMSIQKIVKFYGQI